MTPSNDLIVSVSGIRGVVGEGLTPAAALAFAAALATYTQGGKIVLSNDGRPSGEMLRHAAELGGNAVVGARYDATEIMQGVTEVLAYGTAVFVEPVNRS